MSLSKELENNKTITCKIKLNSGCRCQSSSLSGLAYNIYEGLHNSKCTDCMYSLEQNFTKNR